MSETSNTDDILPLRYAGLLLRMIAGLADIGVIWLFAWLVSSLLGLPFLAGTADQLADTERVHMLIAIVLFCAWLYMAGLETSGLQATLGMAVMGIYIADMAGARAGMGRTTIRFWMRFLSTKDKKTILNEHWKTKKAKLIKKGMKMDSEPNKKVSGTFKITCNQDLIWCRKIEGGFPDIKELKKRVRDFINPDKKLGHLDRS